MTLFSCEQNDTKQKELELRERELVLKEKEFQQKTDSLKDHNNVSWQKDAKDNAHISTQEDLQNQTDYLSKWLSETIGCDFPVGVNVLSKANFNSSNYQTKASSTLINKITMKENGKKPEITSSNKLITIAFNDDEGYETFFAEENTFIYSHHLNAGSNGGSIVYDLKTQKLKEYPFTFNSIQNGIASVGRDGYGSENGQSTGHWWQEGKLDLASGKITWGAKEY
jgi:hypothetical protein